MWWYWKHTFQTDHRLVLPLSASPPPPPLKEVLAKGNFSQHPLSMRWWSGQSSPEWPTLMLLHLMMHEAVKATQQVQYAASLIALLQCLSKICRSLSIICLQFVFGLPLFFWPWGFHWRTWWASLEDINLETWPSQPRHIYKSCWLWGTG